MELNQIILGDYKGSSVVIEYVIDLPKTYGDFEFFNTRVEHFQLLKHLEDNNIIRRGEIEAFRSGGPKFGYLYKEDKYWETLAVWVPSIGHYHVIRFESEVSKVLTETRKNDKILFRFHSNDCVFNSVKNSFTIRDGKELANIVRARGFDFKELKVRPYAFDKRINWLTHLVTIDGKAIGYTNQPVYIEEPIHE